MRSLFPTGAVRVERTVPVAYSAEGLDIGVDNISVAIQFGGCSICSFRSGTENAHSWSLSRLKECNSLST